MYKGSLVGIDDLSNGQIEDILDLAQDIQEDPGAYHGLASGQIMACLFLEPSTRTRGSFEAAMKRLGGDTITTSDVKTSSMAKGESLADTIRIWSGYSDLIVLRHPWDGSARLATEFSEVPVINAGDGSHEHPTQTLLDLYTLRKELGTLEGRNIVLCGDLKNGRTVHSLIYGLLRFGAQITFMHGEGLELPDNVRHKIEDGYGRMIQRVSNPGHLMALYGLSPAAQNGVAPIDALYITPNQAHMRALYEDASKIQIDIKVGDTDAIYITRIQQEREAQEAVGGKTTRLYPTATPLTLKGPQFRRTILLHPLPRVDELDPQLDSDSRSKYFEQARNGVPVRMALIALMLGLRPWRGGALADNYPLGGQTVYSPHGIECENSDCVRNKKSQNTAAEFSFFEKPVVRFVCSYCEGETFPAFYRYPWGEVYRPIKDFPSHPLDPSTSAFFPDEKSAKDSGLRPSNKLSGSG